MTKSSRGALLRACLAALVVATGGCASLPAPDTEATDAPTSANGATEAAVPAFDWPAEQARLIAAFAHPGDIGTELRDDGALVLRLPAAEGFGRDSDVPTAPLKRMLDRVADVLAEEPATEIKVLGHTDSVGSETYNLALSIRRAEAVMEYLRGRGVALARLLADGRGEAEPIADNRSEAGRAINRRVEIVVRPFH